MADVFSNLIQLPSIDNIAFFFSMGIAVVGGIIYFILKQSGITPTLGKKFPIKAFIFEQRGASAVLAGQDGATLLPGEGIYKLHNRKTAINAQDYKHLLPGKEILLFSPRRNVFWPLDIMLEPYCAECDAKAVRVEVKEKDEDGNVKPQKGFTDWQCPINHEHRLKAYAVPTASDEMKYLFANAMEKTYQQYNEQTPMEKYLPILSSIVVALIIGGLFYLATTQAISIMQTAAGALVQVSQNLAIYGGKVA